MVDLTWCVSQKQLPQRQGCTEWQLFPEGQSYMTVEVVEQVCTFYWREHDGRLYWCKTLPKKRKRKLRK